jgi:hypothetical protein
MNVICKKATSKLIKDGVYKVVMYNNINSKNYSFFRPTIRIYINDSTIQTFPLDNFKPVDSDSFSQINWMCPDYQLKLNEREQTKIDENLKAGDYVVSLYDSLKTLVKGRKYKVVDVTKIKHKNSSGAIRWTDIKIKLEGSHRYYASYNFRKCTHQESREIGLSQLFDEVVQTEKVNKHKRKFDYYSVEDKTKILLDLICVSSQDRYRHNLDIIDWTIQKSGIKYKLTREDFDSTLNLKLSEILDILK